MTKVNVRRPLPVALAVGGVVTALAVSVAPTLAPQAGKDIVPTAASAGTYQPLDRLPGDIFRRTEMS